MERQETRLLAPYKALGQVCSSLAPAFRPLPTRRMTSILCAVDNVVLQYSAERLRLISISDTLPARITSVAADGRYVYAAIDQRVAALHLSRQVRHWYTLGAPVCLMLPFGDHLIVVDSSSRLTVVDVENGEHYAEIHLGGEFETTGICHPSTYLNKILLASKQGSLKLLNVKTGKLIHDFATTFTSAITVVEQSTALDVVAVGCESGEIALVNLKFDEVLFRLRQDWPVTAIAFRNDSHDPATLVSAGDGGQLTMWDLDAQRLIGQMPTAHTSRVTALHFLTGQAVMVSTGGDNAMRTWIFDQPDAMARQLVVREGHSQPVTCVRFNGREWLLSAGLDASVRAFSVYKDTKQQKLGTAGLMSRTKAKRAHRDLSDIQLQPVEEMDLGWAREASWDNVVCRHRHTALVTTWTTRAQRLGTHHLLHARFTSEPSLAAECATAVCVTSCGNFALVGYTSGHVDCFNVQSGQHRKCFVDPDLPVDAKRGLGRRAHAEAVNGLCTDALNQLVLSGCLGGRIKFWSFKSRKRIGELKVGAGVARFRLNRANSLLAAALISGSIGVVDILCRRVVRIFPASPSRGQITALEFSPDGKWLLSADEAGKIRIWDLPTGALVDVMALACPCLSMSFNSSGEYLATCHRGERAVYLWVNKAMHEAHVCLKALPEDYEPERESALPGIRLTTATTGNDEEGRVASAADSSDDRREDISEPVVPVDQIENLITLSGLPPARWAQLPDLELIRERNKPKQPPEKPKTAPFFLPTVTTLTGFEFEKQSDDPEQVEKQRRKAVMAKRAALENETPFARALISAQTDDERLSQFAELRSLSVSAIHFHIAGLPSSGLLPFLRMILTVLRSRRDYELVQSYMATFLRKHHNALWRTTTTTEEDKAIDEVLDAISREQKASWSELQTTLNEVQAVTHWMKSAVV